MRPENILCRGSAGSNTPQIYTTLKAARLPATSTLRHPSGYHKSHVAEVIDKKASLEFAPGSIWARSTSLASSAQTALLHTARLRAPLSSWRNAVDLRAFRLKDVLQPPGAYTDVQNDKHFVFIARHRYLFPASRQFYVTWRHCTSLPGIQSASFYCKCLSYHTGFFFLPRTLAKSVEG